MKKFILSIGVIIISLSSFSQLFPIPQGSGTTSTLFTANGGVTAKAGVINAKYTDTFAANLNPYIKNYPGAQIFTTTDNTFWVRNTSVNRWLFNGNGGVSSSCELDGGRVSWYQLLVFDVTAASFCIDKKNYTSAAGSVTLDPSDPSLPRQDVIAVDTFGNVIKITGIPAADPAAPQVDPSYQYQLTTVIVNAGATTPSGVYSAVIWNENTGTPEWVGSASGLVVDFNYATPANVYIGTKSTNVGAFTTNFLASNIIGYTGAVGRSTDSFNVVKFFLKLKSTLSNSANIKVALMSGATQVTAPLTLGSLQGFSKTSLGAFQNITIFFTDFVFNVATSTIDGLRFITSGANNNGFYIDYITLNGGLSNSSGNYVTNVFKKLGTDSIYQVINGIPVFIYKDGGGETGTASLGVVKVGVDYRVEGRLNTIPDIATFNGSTTKIDVKDTIRGGTFHLYTGAEVADGGVIITDALGRKWKRDNVTDYVRPDWWGYSAAGNNFSFVRSAIDYTISHNETKTVKFGNKTYIIDSTIKIYLPIKLRGEGIFNSSIGGTKLQFPTNVEGIKFLELVPPAGYDYTAEMSDMTVNQVHQPNPYLRDSTKNVITIRCKMYMDNVNIDAGSGNGLDIRCSYSNIAGTYPTYYGSPDRFGQCNGSVFTNIRINSCYNGVYVQGTEANAIVFSKLFSVGNRRWGVFDDNFLGNTYIAPQIDFNGSASVAGTSTVVTYAGKWWAAYNIDTIVNINKQPDINPTFWKEVDAMSAVGAWSSTREYFGGGAMSLLNPNAWNMVLNGYVEGYQPPIYLNNRSQVLNGDIGSGVRGGSYLHTIFGQLWLNEGSMILPTVGQTLAVGGQPVSPATGYFKKSTAQVNALQIDAGVGSTPSILFTSDESFLGKKGQIRFNNSHYMAFNSGDVDILTLQPSLGVYPSVDNTYDLGNSSNRWKEMYAMIPSGVGTKSVRYNSTTGRFTFADTTAGSGTVNYGNQNRLAYYGLAGTTIYEAPVITANRALVSDGSGIPVHSAVTATELSYVSGATSSLQTQINGKEPALGNPATNGYVLSSTTVGVRSWVAAGGGVVKETHTTGAAISLANATTWLIVNPAATLAALTVTLPATPTDGQDVLIQFGGTVTSGDVVTAITISPVPIQATTPINAEYGEALEYRWNSTNSKWYRK